MTDEATGRIGRMARSYAAVIVRLRWLVVALWLGLLARATN